ncbi:hypothetical protein LEP1GSC047_0364 [Leptospira inadai serovar Lyme str. 10]|uniref:Uncharacterized protein n=1 Tax=Leptospira inadai serovar Lyme str. 10 TaxID=1049790 RepID=V6H9L6_9LEPT|nr:hypothetical protein LEP1GSC047_0364 [Leptospira inadai serovar Lyme str. 10]
MSNTDQTNDPVVITRIFEGPRELAAKGWNESLDKFAESFAQ